MSRAQTERAEPKRITNPSRKRYSRRNDPRAKWFHPTKEIFFCAHFCESPDVENSAKRSNWRCSDEHGEFFRWQEFPRANWSSDRDFTDLGRAVMVDPKIPRPQELRQPRQRYFIRTVL